MMGNEVLTLRAPAKINLGLRVLARRPDGYHDIETVMVKLDLADTLHLRRQNTGISLHCPRTDLPADGTNLAWRAAATFFAHTGISPAISITLEKYIPIAAGLGGGSSDAAAVLTGLNTFFRAGLTEQQLCALAKSLGADVPFFVAGCHAALATGIGERLEPVAMAEPFWCVLVNPDFSVSTRWVYENLTLTTPANPFMLGRFRQAGCPLSLFSSTNDSLFVNDLETVTVERHPVIGEIKQLLMRRGAFVALMSGSGPTVFGLFRAKGDASDAADVIRLGEPNAKVFVAAPLYCSP